MVGSSNSTTGPRVLANRPVLVKGCRAGNRRLINLLMLVDIIYGAIAGDRALVGHGTARVVGAIVF